MACGSCGKKRKQIPRNTDGSVDVLAGYSNLNDRQIRARLEVYKRKYCKNCDKRYDCDYKMYLECKKSN